MKIDFHSEQQRLLAPVLSGFFGLLILSTIFPGCKFKNTNESPPSHMEPLAGSTQPGPSSTPNSYQPPNDRPNDKANDKEGRKESDWMETKETSELFSLNGKVLKPKVIESLRDKFSMPRLEKTLITKSGFQILHLIEQETVSPNETPKSVSAGTSKKFFLLPKVYVHGTSQGGNVLQISSKDKKTLAVTFPIALVDGQRQILTAYEGQMGISLPESYLITDLEKIKQDLNVKYGSSIELQTLSVCPKKMIILQEKGGSKKEYPVRPTWNFDNQCPLNEFFTVTVAGPKVEMLELIQQTLTGGIAVQLQLQLQVVFSEPTGIFELTLDSQKLFTKLRTIFFSETRDTKTHLYSDLHRNLLSSFQEILIESAVLKSFPIPSSTLNAIIQALIDSYFDQTTDSNCQDPDLCFQLKSHSSHLPLTLDFQWMKHELLGVSEIYPTQVFLQGLAESYPLQMPGNRAIAFYTEKPTAQTCQEQMGRIPGCQDFSCQKFPESVYCRTPQAKATVHAFQVFPGSKIKLDVHRITEWTRELIAPSDETPSTAKNGTLKCADSQPIPGACTEYEEICVEPEISYCSQPKEVCLSDRSIYEDHCQLETKYERGCGFLGLGICEYTIKDSKKTCSKIEVGKECLRWSTECQVEFKHICPKKERRCKTPTTACQQYTTEFYSRYVYSEPWVRPRSLDLSKGETIEQLWDGLEAEISWLAEDGIIWKSVSCPLKAFRHEMNGTTLVFEIANQPNTNCQPFNDWNIKEGRWPTLSIVNHISFDRMFLCGSLDWTHTVNVNPHQKERIIDQLLYSCPEAQIQSSSPIVQVYRPIIDLQGTVSILGRSLGTLIQSHQGLP